MDGTTPLLALPFKAFSHTFSQVFDCVHHCFVDSMPTIHNSVAHCSYKADEHEAVDFPSSLQKSKTSY